MIGLSKLCCFTTSQSYPELAIETLREFDQLLAASPRQSSVKWPPLGAPRGHGRLSHLKVEQFLNVVVIIYRYTHTYT